MFYLLIDHKRETILNEINKSQFSIHGHIFDKADVEIVSFLRRNI